MFHSKIKEYLLLFDRLFEGTKKGAEDPVRAARAYQDIVEAVEEAAKAAQKALDDVESATNSVSINN